MGVRATKPAGSSRRIEAAVHRCAGHARVVLAVSGGRDSMALLHAAARAVPASRLLVATFDHATGAAATRAAGVVAAEGARLGLPVVVGRARENAGTEAGWREARHAFLREVAAAFGGRVMTAHTRDDQVETVLMRVLRGAGARGLAGLYAGTAVLRPLLGFSREDVAAYATAAGAAWMEDPTNASTAFLRNRVRRDLLPALQRASPDLGAALLRASRDAAALRRQLDRLVSRVARVAPHRATVDASIAGRSDADLRLVWPAVAARVGLAMDRRGTGRAAAFTREGRVGARIPLSGGWEIARARDAFVLHRPAPPVPEAAALVPGLAFQEWRFHPAPHEAVAPDGWVALLPQGPPLSVRSWRAGDRMQSGGLNRRVKRYLGDAGVTGEQRARWPVVLSGDEIVWIPGVRRSDAAAVRPGRPGVLYRCDCDRR